MIFALTGQLIIRHPPLLLVSLVPQSSCHYFSSVLIKRATFNLSKSCETLRECIKYNTTHVLYHSAAVEDACRAGQSAAPLSLAGKHTHAHTQTDGHRTGVDAGMFWNRVFVLSTVCVRVCRSSQHTHLLFIPTPLKFGICLFWTPSVHNARQLIPLLVDLSVWSGLTGKSHKPLTNAGLHYRRTERLQP